MSSKRREKQKTRASIIRIRKIAAAKRKKELAENIKKVRDPAAVAARKKIREEKYKSVSEKKRRKKFTEDIKKIAEMKPDTRPSTRAYATPMDRKKRKHKGMHSTSKAGNQWIIYY